jgi:hypothetical protein
MYAHVSMNYCNFVPCCGWANDISSGMKQVCTWLWLEKSHPWHFPIISFIWRDVSLEWQKFFFLSEVIGASSFIGCDNPACVCMGEIRTQWAHLRALRNPLQCSLISWLSPKIPTMLSHLWRVFFYCNVQSATTTHSPSVLYKTRKLVCLVKTKASKFRLALLLTDFVTFSKIVNFSVSSSEKWC